MHIYQIYTNSIGDYDVKPSWLHPKKPYLMWKLVQMKSVSFSRWEDFPVDKYIILFMSFLSGLSVATRHSLALALITGSTAKTKADISYHPHIDTSTQHSTEMKTPYSFSSPPPLPSLNLQQIHLHD